MVSNINANEIYQVFFLCLLLIIINRAGWPDNINKQSGVEERVVPTVAAVALKIS